MPLVKPYAVSQRGSCKSYPFMASANTWYKKIRTCCTEMKGVYPTVCWREIASLGISYNIFKSIINGTGVFCKGTVSVFILSSKSQTKNINSGELDLSLPLVKVFIFLLIDWQSDRQDEYASRCYFELGQIHILVILLLCYKLCYSLMKKFSSAWCILCTSTAIKSLI